MGQFLSLMRSESKENGNVHVHTEDQPWVWAIIDTEILDWKKGSSGSLPPEEINAIAKAQSNLPVEISNYLYLSDAKHAHNIGRITELGITHVLNVAGKAAAGPQVDYELAGIHVLNIDADDEEGYPMLPRHLQQARSFIEQARLSNGRCVVHCVAGINRSGVIVAAEKMLNEKMPVLEVVAYCRRQRGNMFLSNESFVRSLVALAREQGLLESSFGESACRALQNKEPTPEKAVKRFKAEDIRGLF